MLTHAEHCRIAELSDEVRVFVFQLLDVEPDLSGDDAGLVAAKCRTTFYTEMARLFGGEGEEQ